MVVKREIFGDQHLKLSYTLLIRQIINKSITIIIVIII